MLKRWASPVYVLGRQLAEALIVSLRYYGPLGFYRVDLRFRRSYLTDGPHRVARRFQRQAGLDPRWGDAGPRHSFHYGATPLSSLEYIARRTRLTADDRVVDLGCGTGLGCFFLARLLRADVHGVELNPEFVQRAQAIRAELGWASPSFSCGDLMDHPLGEATVVFVYSTGFTDTQLTDLVDKMGRELSEGALVISVSSPLSAHATQPLFTEIDRFPVHFPWGQGTVFVQARL
jgi:SAM-dependent methyltransferase